MKKFIDFIRSPDFKRFVKIRRIWFVVLLLISFLVIAPRIYDGDCVIGDVLLIILLSLAVTTIVSLASIPLVAIINWKGGADLNRTKARIAYIVLMLFSLAIPIFHHVISFEDDMHRVRDMSATGFTPATLLLVSWLADASIALTGLIILFFFLSLKKDEYLKSGTLFFLTGSLLVYLTVYGVYTTYVLTYYLPQRTICIQTPQRKLGNVITAFEVFEVDCGFFPRPESWADDLLKGEGIDGWHGPYLKGGAPKDSWGRDLRYALVNGKPVLTSAGSDGEFGTDDDIRAEGGRKDD